MNWFRTLVVGVITAVAGCIGTGTMAALFVDWFRIPAREGESGYYIVLLGLLGLVGGFVVGLVSARIVAARPKPGFLKGLGVSLGTSAGILVVITGFGWLSADFPPTLDGRALVVETEVKLPAGMEIPKEDPGYEWQVSITADHGDRHQTLDKLRLEDAKRSGDRWVVPAMVNLGTSDPGKALCVMLGARDPQCFGLPLPGRPSHTDMEWSEWMSNPTSLEARPVPPGDAVAVRYRVQYWVEPPPPPTEQELKAKADADVRAAFAKLTPDSSLEDWLAFTKYDEPEDIRDAAADAIAGRPDAAKELSALIRSDDHEKAQVAMFAVSRMKTPPDGLGPAIDEVGHGIANDIREVNSLPANADQLDVKVDEISARFHAWTEAVRILHDRRGLDARPELSEILGLAGVRKDSNEMQMNVVRVASYYLDAWK